MKPNYLTDIRETSAQLNSPKWEATKEGFRLFLFFMLAQFLTGLLDFVHLLPDTYCYKGHCFPLRLMVSGAVTLGLRILDKYTHERNKESGYMGKAVPMGISPV